MKNYFYTIVLSESERLATHMPKIIPLVNTTERMLTENDFLNHENVDASINIWINQFPPYSETLWFKIMLSRNARILLKQKIEDSDKYILHLYDEYIHWLRHMESLNFEKTKKIKPLKKYFLSFFSIYNQIYYLDKSKQHIIREYNYKLNPLIAFWFDCQELRRVFNITELPIFLPNLKSLWYVIGNNENIINKQKISKTETMKKNKGMLKKMITISPIYKNKLITKLVINTDPRKLIKKTFISTLYNNLYRRPVIRPAVLPLITQKIQTCNMATYVPYVRIAEPIKIPGGLINFPKPQVDPSTGYEIMSAIDYSGKNHLLLGDKDFIHENFYMILGTFTTSPSPFLGKKPVFISEKTLKGQNKYQYVHIYGKPKVILKTEADIELIENMCWPPKEVLDKIIEEFHKNNI